MQKNGYRILQVLIGEILKTMVVARNDEALMTDIEKQIWDSAMRRVAEVFGIALDSLRPELKFGEQEGNGGYNRKY